MNDRANVCPVLYAGRFSEEVKEAGLSEDCLVLSEWDVMPSQLAEAVDKATVLAILDPLSFPFEAMDCDQWEVPLILLLPREFALGVLDGMFEAAVFTHLGFFDRIATSDPRLWKGLSRKYRWAESQYIELDAGNPVKAAVELQAHLEAEHPPGGEKALSRTACGVRRYLRLDKTTYRKQAAALEPQFIAARGERAEDVPFDVLEVGAGDGRWAASLGVSARFTGLDTDEEILEVARTNFPGADFDVLEDGLAFPYEDETFDLVFTASVLHHNPTPAKRTLLSEMWRVTRPGGRLMFLEDFVSGGQSGSSATHPMSVTNFVGLVMEATVGRVTLEHVESIRYPRDDLVRGGLISLAKLGIPQKW